MRNLKKLFAVVVVIAVVLTTMIPAAFAEGTTALSADAKACADIGMLVGDGSGVTAAYTATQPARIQALVMILNLKGVLADAQKTSATADNFSDVTAGWMKPLTAYAKAHPELGFVGSNNKFDPNSKIDAKQYYSVMLTALGYKSPDDYTWATVLSKAASVGLTKNLDVSKFTVNDLAAATIETLKAKVKGQDVTLAEKLAAADATFAAKAQAAGILASTANLAVTRINVINASQFQVVFNKEVDSTTAEDETFYKIDDAALNSTNDLAKVQADGKTVLVSLSTAFANDKGYSIKVDDGKVRSKDLAQTAPAFTTSYLASDKVVPSIVSISSATITNTKTVNVTFSEPLKTASAVSIDGVAASVTTAPGTIASGNSAKITVTAGQDLKAGSTHTITFYNVEDNAGNAASPFAPVSQSFTVLADTNAPKLVSATANSENQVKLTFDKSVTNTGALFIVTAVGITSIANSSAVDTNDDHSIILTLTGLTYDSNNQRVVYVDIKGLKDTSGNVMANVSGQVVTLTKDTTAPTYVSNEIGSGNTAVTLKFSEDIKANTVVGTTGLTLVNSKGVDVTSKITGYTTVKSDKITTGVAGPYVQLTTTALDPDTYSLSVAGGTFKDNSTSNNDFAATTISITVGSVTDTSAFDVSGVVSAGTNKFAVTFGRSVVGGNVAGSATNTGYYMLDNTLLPAGTTITLNSAQTTATITLPDNSVLSTKATTLTVSGVKSLSGGTVNTKSFAVNVVDNSKPTVVTAEATSPTEVTLTFNKPVTAGAVAVAPATCYTVTDGVSYTGEATAVNVTGTKVKLTVPTMSGVYQSNLKITVAAGKITSGSTSNDKIDNIAVADKFITAQAFTMADTDATATGADGRDFSITYTAIADTDAYQYKLYVFSSTGAPTIGGTGDLDSYVAVWNGTSLPATGGNFGAGTVLTTSDGKAFAAGNYDCYIVTIDNAGNKSVSAKVTLTGLTVE